MTTFTLNDEKRKFDKTSFNTAKELYAYLSEELAPVSVFLVDDETIPLSIYKSIEEDEQEGESDLVDFRG